MASQKLPGGVEDAGMPFASRPDAAARETARERAAGAVSECARPPPLGNPGGVERSCAY